MAALVEDPPWSSWDVLGLAFLTLVAMVVCIAVVSVALLPFIAKNGSWTESAVRPEVIVTGQLLAYLLLFFVMHALVGNRTSRPVLNALQWNWPSTWTNYLLAGFALEVCLLPFAYLLPMPKNLPLDEFFKTARDAYILSVFGIFFAPLFEELCFRGFLFPVLNSWLNAVLRSQERTRLGRNLIAAIILWGYSLQRLPAKYSLYSSWILVGLAIALSLIRIAWPNLEMAGRLALPIAAFGAWGLVSHAIHGLAFFTTTVLLVILAVGLTLTASHPPNDQQSALIAVVSAIIITSLAFASIHATQLKYSWGPVLVIFIVGLALTTVRAVKKSVAATVLMHMAYNGTIFIVTFIATDGFRHMDRFNQ